MEDWIHVNPNSGQGDKSINVLLDENIGPERNSTLKISTSKKEVNVNIYQEACSCNHQLLKDILTYRTSWNNFILKNNNVKYTISDNGHKLTINKFVPSALLFGTDLENPTNTEVCSIFSNWKLLIKGIAALNTAGKLSDVTYSTWGGGYYYGAGLTFSPITPSDVLFIENFPWDLGVSNGKLKNPNRSYAKFGYLVDGVQNVFNIESFPSNSSSLGSVYNLGLIINGGPCLTRLLNSIAANRGATLINSNCVEVTTRLPYSETFVGSFLYGWMQWNNVESIQVKITGLKPGDTLYRIFRTSSTGPLENHEGEEITEDGIYTITPVKTANIQAGFLLMGDPDDHSPVRVSLYRDGLDNEGYLDVSDNPIELTILPTNTEYPLWRQECWEYIDSKGTTYPKAKTVDNCLMKYYGGHTNNYGTQWRNYYNDTEWKTLTTKIIPASTSLLDTLFGGIDTLETPKILFPDMSEITDLDNYDNMSLVIQTKDKEASNYLADWLSSKFASKYRNIDRRIVRGSDLKEYDYVNSVSGWQLVNDVDHPLVLNIPERVKDDLLVYNNTFADYYRLIVSNERVTGSVFDYVKFVCNQSYQTTVLQNTFVNTVIKNLAIQLNGNNDYAFNPFELINTFAWSSIGIVPNKLINWSNVRNIQYCFDWSHITQVLDSNNNVIVVNNDKNYVYGTSRWPCPIVEETGEVITNVSLMAMQFINAAKLQRFEPILNVLYGYKGSKTAGFHKMIYDTPDLTYIRIQNLNCDDWDFVNDIQIPNLSQECIQYLIEHACDLITTPFNPDNVVEGNVPTEVTDGTTFDPINIRSSKSVNGLKIIAPESWRNKITSEIIQTANNKGWHIWINNAELSA